MQPVCQGNSLRNIQKVNSSHSRPKERSSQLNVLCLTVPIKERNDDSLIYSPAFQHFSSQNFFLGCRQNFGVWQPNSFWNLVNFCCLQFLVIRKFNCVTNIFCLLLHTHYWIFLFNIIIFFGFAYDFLDLSCYCGASPESCSTLWICHILLYSVCMYICSKYTHRYVCRYRRYE